MPEFDQRVSVQLHQSDFDALMAIAEAEDRSLAYIIREAIAEFLAAREQDAGQT